MAVAADHTMSTDKVNQTAHHNHLAEQAIIGFVIYSADVAQFEQVEDDLKFSETTFWDGRHVHIYEAAKAVVKSGRPPNIIHVIAALTASNKLGASGGTEYLHSLASIDYGPHIVRTYCQEVLEKFILRRIHADADQFREITREPGQRPIAELVDQMDQMALKYREMLVSGSDEVDIKKELGEIISVYQNASQGITIPSVPTGFSAIDSRLGGFRSGELVVIGARPKIGKTTLGINAATFAAKQGYPVGIFTLEMKAGELLQRIIASESGVPAKAAEHGYTDDQQKAQMVKAMARVSKLPLMIRDQFTITVDQISLQCRKWKKRNGLKMVLIDYLQLVNRSKTSTTAEAIAEITRKLKNLAGDLDVPIVLISQLNRLSDTDQRPPRLSDLRDSGSIEQDANLIFLLHPDQKEHSKIHLIMAGRRCPSDSDTLLFHRQLNRFENDIDTSTNH